MRCRRAATPRRRRPRQSAGRAAGLSLSLAQLKCSAIVRCAVICSLFRRPPPRRPPPRSGRAGDACGRRARRRRPPPPPPPKRTPGERRRKQSATSSQRHSSAATAQDARARAGAGADVSGGLAACVGRMHRPADPARAAPRARPHSSRGGSTQPIMGKAGAAGVGRSATGGFRSGVRGLGLAARACRSFSPARSSGA